MVNRQRLRNAFLRDNDATVAYVDSIHSAELLVENHYDRILLVSFHQRTAGRRSARAFLFVVIVFYKHLICEGKAFVDCLQNVLIYIFRVQNVLQQVLFSKLRAFISAVT